MVSPLRRSVKATRALSLGSSRRTRRCDAPFSDMCRFYTTSLLGFTVHCWPLLFANGIGQRSDFFDDDAHLVAIFKPQRRVLRHAYAVRRAGEDGGSRQQRRALTEELDQRGDVANHISRVAVLHHTPLHLGRNS